DVLLLRLVRPAYSAKSPFFQRIRGEHEATSGNRGLARDLLNSLATRLRPGRRLEEEIMIGTTKPLLDLCAGDLMSPNVVMIPQEMSLQGAARLLSRSQVGGAPVVDEDGRCVGVLSSADYLHWVEGGQQGGKHSESQCMCSAWQIIETDKLPECLV